MSVFVRKRPALFVYMSRTTFHEWLRIKDGRRGGCSEEVVAKGKGHARKSGRRQATVPTNQGAVRLLRPGVLVWNRPATQGRLPGMTVTSSGLREQLQTICQVLSSVIARKYK